MRKLAVWFLTAPVRSFFFWSRRFTLRRRLSTSPRPNVRPILVGLESRDLPGETVTGLFVAALALPLHGLGAMIGHLDQPTYARASDEATVAGGGITGESSTDRLFALDEALRSFSSERQGSAGSGATNSDEWAVSTSLSGAGLDDFDVAVWDLGNPFGANSARSAPSAKGESPVDPATASGGGGSGGVGSGNTASGAGRVGNRSRIERRTGESLVRFRGEWMASPRVRTYPIS